MNCNVYIFAVSIQIHNVLLACVSIMQSANHTWKIQSESLEKELEASKAKSQELTTKVKKLNVSYAIIPCEI